MIKTTVVIPSYNPDVKLSMFVDELIMSGFSDIVIVDDGSDYGIRKVKTSFEYVKKKKECKILHHGTNMGKGMALKTGFKYCMVERPEDTLIITADDDEHYSVEQIKECLTAYEAAEGDKPPVMIASRDFHDSQYAKRRVAANATAGFLMKYLCGVNIKDVQSGLRLIPHEYLDKVIQMPGAGFDFEINMLVEMKYQGIPCIEHIISMEDFTTVNYAKYNPVLDILKLIGVMLKYAVSSLSATVVDLVAFYILLLFFDKGIINIDKSAGMLLATIVARIISSTFNCVLNKKAVFKSDAPMKGVIIKFYIFSLARAAISYGMVLGVSYILGSYADTATVAVKMLVDLVLFFAGYEIQKKWIF